MQTQPDVHADTFVSTQNKSVSKGKKILNFLNHYMLIIFSIFLGLYVWAYPEVFEKTWNNLRNYSGQSTSNITFESLFQALLFLLFASYLIRRIKNFLDKKLLSYLSMDIGIKHTITTLLGYVFWITAILITLSIVGIHLKNLALVAGALSVGIGFGLQNVVNNFVSGLLILFERPIKEGDWVIINGQEGIVKNIRIRSTEIETFDQASVLIPNADILSGNVINWTHNNMCGRVDVPVGVSYDSDLVKVRDLLLEIAAREPALVKDPAPYVWITSFGESSVDMELRGVTKNVMNKGFIKSQLMFTIFEEFARAGIEIPFPQRVVHVKKENND